MNALASLVCLLLVGLGHYHRVAAPREPMTLASLATAFKFVFATRIILGIITLDMFAVLCSRYPAFDTRAEDYARIRTPSISQVLRSDWVARSEAGP